MLGAIGRSNGGDGSARSPLVVLLGAVLVCVVLLAPAVARAEFGVVPGGLKVSITNTAGEPDVQAGSHPYALSTGIQFNQTTNLLGEPNGDGAVKDIHVAQPTGLTGDPFATPRCSQKVFRDFTLTANLLPVSCPNNTVVGEVTLTSATIFDIPLHYPIYNLVPRPGVAAEFGFIAIIVPVTFDLTVRSGGDYGVTANLNDVSESLSLTETNVTLWGVPADPAHDTVRGNCLGLGGESEGTCPAGVPARPLLTLPTVCGVPLLTGLSVDSWADPGVFVGEETTTPGMEGCGRLDFSPSVVVAPDSRVAGGPTGLGVDVRVPQNEDPDGLGEALPKKIAVTLPAGMAVDPSAASGLGACSEQQIGLNNGEPALCPDSSKVGTVQVETPALEHPLVGSVYVAQQGSNPFGSLLALYVVAEEPVSGVLVKLAGQVTADPTTGQLTATFDDIPQQPFSDFHMSLFGGSRAVLVNPSSCGSYTATAVMTPYSGEAPVDASSTFAVDEGCATGGFAPGFSAGTTSNQAGGFGAFTTTFSRNDGEQLLGGVSVTAPPGLLGLISSLTPCPEPQAAQGVCPASSLIGHTTAAAGAGPDPFYLGGSVYLTGPYKGAPFGLSVVVPAVAGPYDLGTVVVRAAVSVDPHTAQVSIHSDPLPTILQGIPLDLRLVNVDVDRQGFMFNPTSCEPLAVTGVLTSTQGTSASVASRFQAAGCAALAFHPSFTVSTAAHTSKQLGASLDVRYTSGAGQANTARVAVTLPKQLPSQLETIQHACPEATFAADPAGCPAISDIGSVTATTPVLANPVTGPAYLVSHGGAEFPDLVMILQGEGVTVDVVGAISIKGDVTSTTLENVPDVPIGTFQLTLPQGPHAALAAVLPKSAKGSLCGQSLVMPTTITAQNGAQVTQQTKIKPVGCTATSKKKKKTKKHPKKHKQGRAGKGGKKNG